MQPVDTSDAIQDEEPSRRFAKAAALFRASGALAAESRLRDILEEWPDHMPSLSLLALIVGRNGRDSECLALLERAIAQGTGEPAAACALVLGAVHERAGRSPAAETAYRRALQVAPRMAQAQLRLGLLLYRDGRLGQAVDALCDAIAIDPGLAVAHGALASALLALGDLVAAADSAGRAVALSPDDPDFLANLAVIYNALGRFTEAEALCGRALGRSDDAGLFNTLGIALSQQDRLDEASAAFERAQSLEMNFVDALYNLGMVRKEQGRTQEAVGLLRRVVTLAPDLAAARFAVCMAHLAPFYADEAEIDRRRSDYAAQLEALIDHAAKVGAAALAPGVGAAQPFYLAYQGRNDLALQQRYGALVCLAMAEAFTPVPLAGPPVVGARIRIGVVCGHIRDHSVWRLPTRGWVANLDRSRFEVIGYHTSPLRDAETDRAVALFDHFVQGPLPVGAWRERIAADRPHALIYPEVGMDPMVAQLAAMRLAHVQYGSWGHPSTTGYPTLDYVLGGDAMEPADGERHYSERLVRLPGLSTPVAVEPFSGKVASRAELGLAPSATVYWCGQALQKYLPQYDGVFAAIAAAAPGGQFVFIAFPGGGTLTARFRERIARAFAARGLDAEAYCVWLPRISSQQFLAAIGCADVVLDSIGWSGCNSLMDALSHSLPIVTLPGPTMRSRHGAAILRLIGLDHLICPTLEAYIDAAARLSNVEAREAAKQILNANVHKLADPGAVRALERHLADAVLEPRH